MTSFPRSPFGIAPKISQTAAVRDGRGCCFLLCKSTDFRLKDLNWRVCIFISVCERWTQSKNKTWTSFNVVATQKNKNQAIAGSPQASFAAANIGADTDLLNYSDLSEFLMLWKPPGCSGSPRSSPSDFLQAWNLSLCFQLLLCALNMWLVVTISIFVHWKSLFSLLSSPLAWRDPFIPREFSISVKNWLLFLTSEVFWESQKLSSQEKNREQRGKARPGQIKPHQGLWHHCHNWRELWSHWTFGHFGHFQTSEEESRMFSMIIGSMWLWV